MANFNFKDFAQRGIAGLRAVPGAIKNASRGFGTSPQARQNFVTGALSTLGSANIPVISPLARGAATISAANAAVSPAERTSRESKSYLTRSADKLTTALSGTPTGTTANQYSSVTGPQELTQEQKKEADARQYLIDENAASLRMGSKNLVQAMRGDTGTEKKADAATTVTTQAFRTPPPSTSADTRMDSQSIIGQLRSRVGSLTAPSAQEAALSDELAQLRGDARMGISGLEGQGRGIPLSLIRGQQAKLTEQAGIQEQTLLDRITAAAAQRQAQLAAANTELGYATQDQARQDQLAQYEQARQDKLISPMEIDGSLIQYNPITGQYETKYNAPAETAKPTADIQNYEYAVSKGYTGSPIDYQRDIASFGGNPYQIVAPGGTAIDQYGNPIYTAPAAEKPISESQKKINFLGTNALAGLTSIENALANIGGGIFGSRALIVTPDYKNAENQLSTFLGYLASGAQIPESEVQKLKGLLPTRFKSDEKAASDLATLRSSIEQYMGILGSNTSGGAQGDGGFTQDDVDYLRSQGMSDAQIQQLVPKANGASGSAQQISAAIRQVESGGNYNARGGSGEYGAYQFMPATWRSWAETYLGNANASMTQQNQDRVAQAKIQDLLNQGYNAQQIALIWNGGEPVVKRGTNRYGVAYDSGAYANKVIGALSNFS